MIGNGVLTACLFTIAVGLTGCTTRALDRRVARTVEQKAARETGITEETIADAKQEALIPVLPPGTTITLNSTSVLAVATDYSRNLQSRRDDLYQSGLSLFSTRRNFGVGINGTVEYVFSGGEDKEDSENGSASLSIDRLIPTGGNIKLSGQQNLSKSTTDDGVETDVYNSSASATLDQPLLAGAGYRASHESLTQAERSYLYALRSFTLERQDFAIRILRDYYSLLSQRKVVANTATNYQQFVYLRERSEALFKVNRAPAIDVLRSQQEEISALNRLTTSRESFQIQVARFNITLGLPQSMETVLEDDIPPLREFTFDENEAIEMALSRRLDLLTQRDRLEDARRKLKVAQNLYLPEVDAFGTITYSSDDAESVSAQEYSSDWEAGVRADIPLDRRDERDAVKNARLSVEAAERQLAETEDTIALEVREGFSQLRSLTVSVRIQLKNIEIAERRAENASLQFRNGALSNRDVVEAANELLNARNAYINALTDYEIQRLTLLRSIGLLDITRDGGIVELSPKA